jgi:hypothetical protein
MLYCVKKLNLNIEINSKIQHVSENKYSLNDKAVRLRNESGKKIKGHKSVALEYNVYPNFSF